MLFHIPKNFNSIFRVCVYVVCYIYNDGEIFCWTFDLFDEIIDFQDWKRALNWMLFCNLRAEYTLMSYVNDFAFKRTQQKCENATIFFSCAFVTKTHFKLFFILLYAFFYDDFTNKIATTMKQNNNRVKKTTTNKNKLFNENTIREEIESTTAHMSKKLDHRWTFYWRWTNSNEINLFIDLSVYS